MDVTIIIPVYNVEKYIKKCLTSILKQSFSNFKCLIVNDGTKDNSIEIATKLISNDNRFEIINKENGGYGSVLECAFNKASTDYCLICDSDDYLEPFALEKLMSIANKDHPDIVVGCRNIVYENTNKVVYDTLYDKKIHINSNTLIKKGTDEYNSFYLISPSPHAKLFKTNIIKELKFPHHTNYTDNALYLFALEKAKIVEHIDEALAYYLINRPENTMSSFSIKYYLDNIKVFNYILDNVLSNKEYNDFILYRLFDGAKVLMYELKFIDDKDFNLVSLNLKEFIERLLPYKDVILNYQKRYSIEGFYAKIKNKKLLSNDFSHYYDKWMKEIKKNES